MRFDKHNAGALEILRKARPVEVKPSLLGFDQKTLVAGVLAVLIALLLIAH
jgi:protein tyrosine/serine phosphatase